MRDSFDDNVTNIKINTLTYMFNFISRTIIKEFVNNIKIF